jgi:hypothetical protein
VPEQSWFDLFGLERLSQQGILEEVDLTDAQIIRGAPVAVHLVEHVRRQRTVGLRRFGGRWPLAATAVDKAASKINLERSGVRSKFFGRDFELLAWSTSIVCSFVGIQIIPLNYFVVISPVPWRSLAIPADASPWSSDMPS